MAQPGTPPPVAPEWGTPAPAPGYPPSGTGYPQAPPVAPGYAPYAGSYAYPGMPQVQTQRSGATTAAAVLMFVSSGFNFLFAALAFLIGALAFGTGRNNNRNSFHALGFNNLANGIGALLLVVGVVLVGFGIWHLTLGRKLLARARWAWTASVVTFGIYAVFQVIGFLGALGNAGSSSANGTRTFNPGSGILGVAFTGATLACLIAGRNDFQRR